MAALEGFCNRRIRSSQWFKMNYMLLMDTTVMRKLRIEIEEELKLTWCVIAFTVWHYALKILHACLANRGCHDEWLEVFVLIQLLQLEQRLAELKKEKHGLFSELKKVLHQENEIRQRETERQIKEQKSVQYGRSSPLSYLTAFCWLTVNHVYFASMKFSRIEKNRKIKYTWIFRNGPSP